MKAFAALSSADKSQTSRHRHAEWVLRLPINVSANVRSDDTGLQGKGACACGGGCPRCQEQSRPLNIQAKLRKESDGSGVSADRDALEQEADRFANFADLPTVEAPVLSLGAARGLPATANPLLHATIQAGVSTPGEAITAGALAHTPPIAADMREVRIHRNPLANAAARLAGAHAYAYGSHIVLGPDARDIDTPFGRRTFVHELAHVGQQTAFRGDNAVPHAQFSLKTYISAMNQKPEPDWAIAAEHLNGESPGTIKIVLKNLSPHYRAKLHEAARVWPGLCSNVGRLTEADYVKEHPETTGRAADTCGKKPEPPAAPVEAGRPITDVLGDEDTVAIDGDPAENSNYIQNAVKGAGIYGWGGPFRLDRKIENGLGVDVVMLLLPRDAVNLDEDPLKAFSVSINKVYKTRSAAEAAVKDFGSPDAYTYYVGPGGHIYPTVISDTTAPALCAALRKAIELERADARAAANLGVNLALWYVGARFPLKAREPSVPPTKLAPPAAAAGAAAGGGEAFVVVEIGAGDLKAAIELAKKGGVKVIAVEPAAGAAGPTAEAIAQLEQAGGTFVRGTAEALKDGTAHHVFQYFPWQIGGTGRFAAGGTWKLISDTVRLLKPKGAAHFVTEDLQTAEFLAKEASEHGLKAVITETAAGAAAPGASGAGVPNFSSSLKVWLVNIYK